MPSKSHLRVSHPPERPLMIWDGDCHFCRLWIERWRVLSEGRVDFVTSQEVAASYPEIPAEQFEQAVVLIVPDGTVLAGAEAVFRSFAWRPSHRWRARMYDTVPGLAAVSEFAYRIVARYRPVASAMTRLLWGSDVRPPRYFWARRWFLRSLGLVYLIAFLSLWVQVDGLIGADGVLPVGGFLSMVHERLGSGAFSVLPTLCWLNSSNAFLHFLCGGGVLLSLLLIVGLAPALCLLGLFAFYLSLTLAGQTFLSFQWDILLLETGFLAIFLAPWRLWPGKNGEPPVSRVAVFLLKLLLFKLMLMSGVVKLTSGDDSLANLTALDYHYWSQPLPTVFAWFFDQHPEWFRKFSVGFCLFTEIVVPFFLWKPRRIRLVAAGLLIFLQLAIALTGNYCFFNLLTIALCLLLIDDATWRRRRDGDVEGRTPARPASQELRPPIRNVWARLQVVCAWMVLLITAPLNAWLIYGAFKPEADPPRLVASLDRYVEPFRVVNGYGLFRVMTRDRREIIIEGSADGVDWLPYEFKWKPGDVNRAPGWCAPHQPRLDWQMWFAALGSPQGNPWFVRLAGCLLENKRDVVGLLARNPFPDKPPLYVRSSFYRYRFTTAAERRETGAWWKRQELGEYLPPVSLR
ncbi:MAG TPA: lipase maturation factor family protein [Chthoniobacterales bacterium]